MKLKDWAMKHSVGTFTLAFIVIVLLVIALVAPLIFLAALNLMLAGTGIQLSYTVGTWFGALIVLSILTMSNK